VGAQGCGECRYGILDPTSLDEDGQGSREFGILDLKFLKFNVLLTVHHAMILGNCPT